MIMSTERLVSHVEPLLGVESVRTIRIGTKALAYWPQRFVGDRDADDLLRLIERVVATGRTLAVMAHVSHPRELEGDVVRRAVERIRAAGAVLYSQAPLDAARQRRPRHVARRCGPPSCRPGWCPTTCSSPGTPARRTTSRCRSCGPAEIYRDAWSGTVGPVAHGARAGHVGDTRERWPSTASPRSTATSVLALRLLQARDPVPRRPAVLGPRELDGPRGSTSSRRTASPTRTRAGRVGRQLGAAPMRVASNLALDQRVNELRAGGVDVLHLGFGEAGLPVHPGLVEALVEVRSATPTARSPGAPPPARAWPATGPDAARPPAPTRSCSPRAASRCSRRSWPASRATWCCPARRGSPTPRRSSSSGAARCGSTCRPGPAASPTRHCCPRRWRGPGPRGRTRGWSC